MKQKAFGLDIGGTTMKVVWLLAEKDGYHLFSALTASTPPKGMASEALVDQEQMAGAIRNLCRDAKITTQFVHMALPESQVYTRVVEMPLLSDKELASAIYWEAEQHIPVPLATITIDWKILQRSSDQQGGKMEVLLAGAPTALIEKYDTVLSMAGLSTVSVETEILSVTRALTLSSHQEQATKQPFPNSIIVNIGAANTPFAIIRSGMIAFTHTVPTGGAAINRAIAQDFGFSLAQAEEYKKAYGVSKDSLGGKIGQATRPILMVIVAEVKKALAFYLDKHKGEEPIRQILLSGGTANLPGIDSFFAENCGIETVIANPWKAIAGSQIAKELTDSAPDYAIAVGLAMKEYE